MMQRKALLFGVAFLIIGGCLLVSGWFGWRAYAGASDWPTVKGRVIEKRVESRPGTDGSSYTPVVLYRFQIGKKMHSGEHSFTLEEFQQAARRKLDHYNAEDLYHLLPMNPKRTYKIEEIMARLVDESMHMEFRPGYGPEVYTKLA
jgi:hypothetical protein